MAGIRKVGKPGGSMSMAQYEKSPMDMAADKSGRHGAEGSAKDRAADKKALDKINKK